MTDLNQKEIYRYPSIEGAKETAEKLGLDYEQMVDCQDWEYTFPVESDLERYFKLYTSPKTSKMAKRVLASFILQSCDNFLQPKTDFCVTKYISPLLEDLDICESELKYWGRIEVPVEHPDQDWNISPLIRKLLIS